MRNIGTIAKHNLNLFFKNPFFILLLVGPIFINVFCSYLLGGMSETPIATVAYYENQGPSKRTFMEQELGAQNIQVLGCESQEAVEQAIRGGKAQLGLVLMPDAKASELLVSEDCAVGTYGQEQIQTILALSELTGQLSERVVVYQNKADNALDILTRGFGIFIMLFLFTCIKSLDPLIRERESTVYERIILSSIKPYEYVLGHVAGCLVILFVEALIQCGLMLMIGQNSSLGMLQLLVVCLVLALIGIAIGIVIYNCVRSSQTYFVAATFVITPLCMLSGCIFPMELLPDFIQKFSYLSPLRWLMTSYEQMIRGGNIVVIGQQLVMALLIALVICLGGLWWNHYKVTGSVK
ncbi:MAG: ABC transporter permease [Cellulosilyticaceae bacterium]